MKYTVVKGTGIHRASVEQPDGTRKAIALFGKVSDLAAQSIIFLDGKPASEKWIVLFAGREESSPELLDSAACKDYIELHCDEA